MSLPLEVAERRDFLIDLLLEPLDRVFNRGWRNQRRPAAAGRRAAAARGRSATRRPRNATEGVPYSNLGFAQIGWPLADERLFEGVGKKRIGLVELRRLG